MDTQASASDIETVTAEIDRLAAIGNFRKSESVGINAIAKALTGGPGQRHTQGGCALARHLAQFTTRPVRVTRYEVFVGEERIPLNDAPGNRCILRYFVCAFDDRPDRFRWLRAN